MWKIISKLSSHTLLICSTAVIEEFAVMFWIYSPYSSWRTKIELFKSEQTLHEPPRDKINKITVRPAKTQISLGVRPVWSVFAVCSLGSYRPMLSSCGQRRLRSDWTDAQADLSLRWRHIPFCWFCQEVAHMVKHQPWFRLNIRCSLNLEISDVKVKKA